MNIAIVDADLISRKKHRFPNLASMKISGYYKKMGGQINLILDWDDLDATQFDKVFLSKVFIDTYVPSYILELSNIEIGGTGFFYDKAIHLPSEIEHHMPDYHLYDEWVETQLSNGGKKSDYRYYTDYSIGFTTRGCFRQCGFCVNKNYKKVEYHSQVKEFVDNSRKYICLLDDNILGYGRWSEIFEDLKQTNKRFEYKQGMDLRIVTDAKAIALTEGKYIGDYIFAFDNIADRDLMEEKFKLWRRYCPVSQTTKLYVFCGFDRNDKWDLNFWKQDMIDTFERIKILMKYGCIPYIMRFSRYEESPYRGMYINLARWCNQPSFFKKKSFREYCIVNGEKSSTVKYMKEFESLYPEITNEYFDLKFESLNEYQQITI